MNPYYYFYNLDDLTVYHFIPFVSIWLFFKIKKMVSKKIRKRKRYQYQNPILSTETLPENFPIDALLKDIKPLMKR